MILDITKQQHWSLTSSQYWAIQGILRRYWSVVVAVAESSCDVLSLRPLQVLSIGYILDIRFVPLSSTCNRDKSLLEVCGRRIFYSPQHTYVDWTRCGNTFGWLEVNLNCCIGGGPQCLISRIVCLVHWLYNCVPPLHLFPTFYDGLHWILWLDQLKPLCMFVLKLKNVTKYCKEALENKDVLGCGSAPRNLIWMSCCVCFLLCF